MNASMTYTKSYDSLFAAFAAQDKSKIATTLSDFVDVVTSELPSDEVPGFKASIAARKNNHADQAAFALRTHWEFNEA